LRNADLALGSLALQTPLLAARETLHDADLAHRHEVVREREPFRGVNRQVVDTHNKLRIGQPPSTGATACAPSSVATEAFTWGESCSACSIAR
jgi:hypothetical protein